MKKYIGSVAVFALVGFLAAMAAWSWHRSPTSRAGNPRHDRAAAVPRTRTEMVITESKRKVYPFSIVAGGAQTVQEARKAMRDPAVKDHYAAVDLAKLKQVTLTKDLYGYVSYRFGDKIYWTAKKLRLKAGETVFTDGQHVVRGRCLNCYSALPMLPTRRNEPSELILDTPVEVPLIALSFPRIPLEQVPTLPPPLELLSPSVPTLPLSVGPGKPGGFFPIIPIIPPIRRHRKPPPEEIPPPIVTPPSPPETPVVPEPNYTWIMAGALFIVILAARWRSRRRAHPQ